MDTLIFPELVSLLLFLPNLPWLPAPIRVPVDFMAIRFSLALAHRDRDRNIGRGYPVL